MKSVLGTQASAACSAVAGFNLARWPLAPGTGGPLHRRQPSLGKQYSPLDPTARAVGLGTFSKGEL